MGTYSELNNKIVVISGAGGNLGWAVVKRMALEKARLALLERQPDRLRVNLRKEQIDETQWLVGAVDLLQKSTIDSFIDQAVQKWGRIDVLVHTAGGWRPGSPVHQMDEQQWDTLVDLNVKAAFLICSAVARQMVAQGGAGRIITVSGRAGLKGDANNAAYSAGKAGLLRLTESMSAELLSYGITVNAVLPSTIDTPQNRQGDPTADFSKWVSPESLADVIAFLASDGARDISGAAIPVYGRS